MNTLPEWGALGFGLIVGWFTYFVNRHRKEDVTIGDVATIIGALGGAAVLALFPAKSDLFGAYGVGLAIGFFGYFVLLVVILASQRGNGWTFEWLLDGRKPGPKPQQVASGGRPMLAGADVSAKIIKG